MGNTQQLYGRLDMVMLDRQDKIYGSLGMHDSYLLNTVTGNPLTLTHSREGKMDDEVTDCKLYGWSKQETTTGKNLFDFSRLVSDGVNVIDYEKQTITVPAKTNNTGYNQTLRDLCPGITPGIYVFSTKSSNPESITGSYFLEASKDFPVNTPIELTDALLDNHIAWCNNSDSEIENVISEIQLEAGDTATAYEPYTGGQPSPNPDYPQEIISAGSDGKINLEVHGKNLVDLTKKIDVQGVYQGWRIPKKDDEYTTITLIDKNESIDIGKAYLGFTGNGKDAKDGADWLIGLGEVWRSVRHSKLGYVSIYNGDIAKILERFDIQVEIGTAPTTYEPYHEPQSISISTPTGLPAIPVDTGGNYTDTNGQQWIADYVDLKRGKYVQWIGKCNLENLSWRLNGNIFNSSKINNSKKYGWTTEIANLICSHYVCNMSAYNMNFNSDGLDNLIGMHDKDVVIKDTRFNNDVELFKKSLNGVYVYYVLNEPIERDLTPEEIQAYNNLVTYAGTTIVENDAECYMECTYKASGNE